MNERLSVNVPLSGSNANRSVASDLGNVSLLARPVSDDDAFSRLEHPFAVRSDADLEGAEAEDVATCRELLVLSVVLVVSFWIVYRITDPSHVDPLWGRVLFASLPGGIALGSYVLSAIRRQLLTFWRFFLYVTVAWFAGLSVLNEFDPAYGLGMLFVVAATSTGFSIGLRRRGPLLAYLAWTTILPNLALLAVESPGIGRLIFFVSLLSLAVIFYVILDWRIRAEDALRESREQAKEASRLKTTIIGNLNHEFRTPLTSILGFAESLEEELSGPQQKRAELIRRSGTRLQRTLKTLLALSRLRADRAHLEPEPINVAEHVAGAVDPFVPKAKEHGLDLRVDLPASSVEAAVNPEAIERIVTVLTDNALKFTEDGYVQVGAAVEEDAVLIVVTDTGIGIDEEAQALLFEPFRQASEGRSRTEEGLGLGLTLVGQLVELMDGTIEVDSEPGEGTRFEVRVPHNSDLESRSTSASAAASTQGTAT